MQGVSSGRMAQARKRTFAAEIEEDQAVASAMGLHSCSLQQLHTQDMYTGAQQQYSHKVHPGLRRRGRCGGSTPEVRN